jgi:L-amino acid N-acyltransferase YncA
MTPSVRRADAGDAEALSALLKSGAAEAPEMVLTGEVPSAQALSGLLGHNGDRFVILVAGDAASGLDGMVLAAQGLSAPLAHTASLSVVVRTSARRSGLGRALVGGAARWAEDAAISRLCVSVLSGNDAAIGLFTALGFRREGLRPGQVRLGEAVFDEVLMGAAPAAVRARAALRRSVRVAS